MAINLTEIKEINSIEELAKHYELIQSYVYQINPSNLFLMDDIVQDTFMKLHTTFTNNPTKVISGGYVAMSLMSVYRDHQRQQRKLDQGTELYEANIPEKIDDYEEVLENKLAEEELWLEFENAKDKLTWYEKKVLEYSFIMPMTILSSESNIDYESLTYTLRKIKAKLNEELRKTK